LTARVDLLGIPPWSASPSRRAPAYRAIKASLRPGRWERSLPGVICPEIIPAFVMEDLIKDQAHGL
jgi:hypothetical protein